MKVKHGIYILKKKEKKANNSAFSEIKTATLLVFKESGFKIKTHENYLYFIKSNVSKFNGLNFKFSFQFITEKKKNFL